MTSRKQGRQQVKTLEMKSKKSKGDASRIGMKGLELDKREVDTVNLEERFMDTMPYLRDTTL